MVLVEGTSEECPFGERWLYHQESHRWLKVISIYTMLAVIIPILLCEIYLQRDVRYIDEINFTRLFEYITPIFVTPTVFAIFAGYVSWDSGRRNKKFKKYFMKLDPYQGELYLTRRYRQFLVKHSEQMNPQLNVRNVEIREKFNIWIKGLTAKRKKLALKIKLN